MDNQSLCNQGFIELKNVTLAEQSHHYLCALFPDAVTTRGQKHLRTLMNLVSQGHCAKIIFIIQRADCYNFDLASHIDPDYARLFHQALAVGVEAHTYIIQINPFAAIWTHQTLPLSCA